MGIVNLTPDSFSDGGRCLRPSDAVDHARLLVAQGAALLDLGAESTRPGARPVSSQEEAERLLPVVEALAADGVPLSIDTRNSDTAEAALAAGASVINDVSALRHDPRIAEVAAAANATLVLMHSRGTPQTMESFNQYEDVVAEVASELEPARRRALDAGLPEEALIFDPGLGFAKTRRQDLELLTRLPELKQRLGGARLLVGASRKRLVGHLLSRGGVPRPVAERASGSVGLALAAVAAGADWVRVHDVAETADALTCFLAARAHGGDS